MHEGDKARFTPVMLLCLTGHEVHHHPGRPQHPGGAHAARRQLFAVHLLPVRSCDKTCIFGYSTLPVYNLGHLCMEVHGVAIIRSDGLHLSCVSLCVRAYAIISARFGT